MTTKKAKAKNTADVIDAIEAPEAIEVSGLATIVLPVDGPDYRITKAGDIVLFDGSPVPEDHHIHPSHRRIAQERKGSST